MESGSFNYFLSHYCTSSFLEYDAGREGNGRAAMNWENNFFIGRDASDFIKIQLGTL